jgi:hypothetical protein
MGMDGMENIQIRILLADDHNVLRHGMLSTAKKRFGL